MANRGANERFPVETVLSVFTEREDPTTPLTASEVATAVGCARRTAYEKLRELTDRGRLRTKRTGAHSRIWWLAPEATSENLRPPLTSSNRALFDRMLDAVFVLDRRWQFRYVNDRAEEVFGGAANELGDASVWDAFPRPKEAFRAEYREAMETQTPTTFDSYHPALDTWFEQILYPFEASLVVQLRDITDRKRRERNLSRYRAIIETVWDGVYALDSDHAFTLANEAYADLTGYSREELLGSPATVVHNETIDDAATQLSAAVETGSQDAATLEFDLERADGTTVPVEAKFGPSPIDAERGGRVGVVRDVTERNRRERRLKRQREQLSALNHLHRVVQEIIQSLVQQSTREEMRRLICERLATAEPYGAAWIGQVDWMAEEVNVLSEAGLRADRDDRSFSFADGDGDGVLPNVIQNQEMRVIDERTTASRMFDRFQELQDNVVAVMPLVYDETVYGVLGVATERPDGFDGYERTVIEQLGEITGHTLSALNRKEALMADDRAELEFYLRDVFREFDLPETEGTITFDRAVPLGDGAFLEYGTVTEDALETLHALVDQLPHFEAVTVLDGDYDRPRFELRLTRPPVISLLASHGGRVLRARITNGDYHMTVEIPQSADVRHVITTVQKLYQGIEVVAQRSQTDPHSENETNRASLLEQLTERQRASLEAAYFAGYFEWPRVSTGEDVASSLDIKPPTFHKHLRKAERTVVRGLLTG